MEGDPQQQKGLEQSDEVVSIVKQEALTPQASSLSDANPNGTEKANNKKQDKYHQEKYVTREEFEMFMKKFEQPEETEGHLQKRLQKSEETVSFLQKTVQHLEARDVDLHNRLEQSEENVSFLMKKLKQLEGTESHAEPKVLSPQAASLTDAHPNGTEETKNLKKDKDHSKKNDNKEELMKLQKRSKQSEEKSLFSWPWSLRWKMPWNKEKSISKSGSRIEMTKDEENHEYGGENQKGKQQKKASVSGNKLTEGRNKEKLETGGETQKGRSEKQTTSPDGNGAEPAGKKNTDKGDSEQGRSGKQTMGPDGSGAETADSKSYEKDDSEQGRSRKQTTDPTGSGAEPAGTKNNDKDYPEQKEISQREVCRNVVTYQSNDNQSLNSSKPNLSIRANTNRTLQFARSFEKTGDYTLKDWTDDVPIALVCECTVDRHISDIQNSLKELKEEQYYKRTIVIYIHEVVPGQKSQYQLTTVERIKMTTEGKELLEKLNYRIVDMFFNKHFEIFKDERNTEAKGKIKKFVQAYTSNI